MIRKKSRIQCRAQVQQPSIHVNRYLSLKQSKFHTPEHTLIVIMTDIQSGLNKYSQEFRLHGSKELHNNL
jgi:hypothetical protein